MKKFRLSVLIVEDVPLQLRAIKGLSVQSGFETTAVSTYEAALEALNEKNFDVLLTDIHLRSQDSDFDGLKIIQKVIADHPEIAPAAMSADPNCDTYQKAMALGATQYVRKPFLNASEFQICIEQSRRNHLVKKQAKLLQGPEITDETLKQLCPDGVYFSAHDRILAQKFAENKEISIYILGETGTGKEEFVKLIHRNREAIYGITPFVPVNCANLNTDLAASHLFGHRKGAFTGADKAHPGVICEANGGILFLDEIHTLSVECQRKLLRVLNDGKYERLGETASRISQFQLISASTLDLVEQCEKGLFLLDLYTRIMGVACTTLPLRERKADFPILIKLIMNNLGAPVSSQLAHELSLKYCNFYWQGNLRHLAKNLQTFVFETKFLNRPLDAESLPIDKAMYVPGGVASENLNPGVTESVALITQLLMRDTPLSEALEQFEKCMLQSTIARHPDTNAARTVLDISRSGFAHKRKRWGLE